MQQSSVFYQSDMQKKHRQFDGAFLSSWRYFLSDLVICALTNLGFELPQFA